MVDTFIHTNTCNVLPQTRLSRYELMDSPAVSAEQLIRRLSQYLYISPQTSNGSDAIAALLRRTGYKSTRDGFVAGTPKWTKEKKKKKKKKN